MSAADKTALDGMPTAIDTLRNIPVNAQTAAYTVALTDRGGMVSMTGPAFTIPSNASVAFPVGSTIVLYNNASVATAIVITSDTLRQTGTLNTGPRTISAYGQATIIKVNTTEWTISGAGLI
ncbi:hypothetical protein [Sphingomonas paeninsulae]|uniref:hypothetical protein n=1 Tax=Sphingomonas paeninsulae TaxID=2319844 RepID=UPI001EF13CC2|nr:hypothetical protein [Sphingomonas paeninsulae]